MRLHDWQRADFHATRHAAIVAVVLYAACVPLVFVALLWYARDAILGPPNPLSSALFFLYADYRDGSKGRPYYLWELLPLMFVKQVGRDVHTAPWLAGPRRSHRALADWSQASPTRMPEPLSHRPCPTALRSCSWDRCRSSSRAHRSSSSSRSSYRWSTSCSPRGSRCMCHVHVSCACACTL